MFWLKAIASRNIWDMYVTEVTFQASRGWLKEVVFLNTPSILVTEYTFQVSRGWLKEAAPANM